MVESDPGLLERMTGPEKELYDEFKSQIGKEFVPRHPHIMFYPRGTEDPVQWSATKRWAYINYDFNALYFDPAYAGKTRWGGVIAPPLFLLAMDDAMGMGSDLTGAIYSPRNIVDRVKYPNFRGSAMANCEWEFFEPIRPGDLIRTKATPRDIFWKLGSRVRLLFLQGEMTYFNQHDRPVSICRTGAVYMFK
jgi:acyl dehydratase